MDGVSVQVVLSAVLGAVIFVSWLMGENAIWAPGVVFGRITSSGHWGKNRHAAILPIPYPVLVMRPCSGVFARGCGSSRPEISLRPL